MKILGLVLLLELLNPLHAAAQSQEASKPSFEVASVKLSGLKLMSTSGYEGEHFFQHGVTLRNLIMRAYGVQDYELSGGPDWIGTIRYDVDAKTAGTVPEAQTYLMLQSLLEKRFKLNVRRENREVPIYSLVTAKGGPKLNKADPDQRVSVGSDGNLMVTDSGKSTPVIRNIPSGPRASVTAKTVSALTDSLTRLLDRRVIDKTGIDGFYAISLEWVPEGAQASPSAVSGQAGSGNAPLSEPAGPSIYDAIQEQLGLKLEPGKSTGVFIVIDSVEKPSGN
jgi:bla regulator protein blaR1